MTAWRATDIPDQTGLTAVVTGANSGLGRVTAQRLAARGAQVVLAVRDTDAGERAAHEIQAASAEAVTTVQELDLADLASVRAFADWIARKHERIDLLINNAGVVMLGARRTTKDGFELQMGTNMLGHFALTGLLLPMLEQSAGARVVSLSSYTHKNKRLDVDDLMSDRRWSASRAYGLSKLAVTVFGIELDRRLRATGSPVVSILAHPGLTRTNLTTRAWAGGAALGRLAGWLGDRLLTQPVDQGALPQLHAATANGVRGGDFFGPDGRGERHGEVTRVRASAEAMDPVVGAELWAAAERLTGVVFLDTAAPRNTR